MAAWVDPLRDRGWRLGPSCHLFADSPDELHAFAAAIGMRRRWFQDKPRLGHYDLTAKRRAQAVLFGAIELGARPALARARRAAAGAPGPGQEIPALDGLGRMEQAQDPIDQERGGSPR